MNLCYKILYHFLNYLSHFPFIFSFSFQAKGKVKKAERALAKVQKNLEPADLPVDLETISDEERSLLRKIGLSMKPYLLIGKNSWFGS